ncbi:MAG: cellulase [Cytophagaceae bacterium]|nr:MAG: cellulase [Cytophagaceae bacterium]
MNTIVLKRTGFTLLALVLGVGLTYGLTYVGTRAAGPLDDALVSVGSGVSNLENKYLLTQRGHTRAQELAWFQPYRRSPAKLRHPDRILLGAFDNNTEESLEPISALEDSLRTHLPIIQVYSAWGSKAEEAFPRQKVEAIANLGSLPLITWEPWLSDFAPEDMPAALADAKTRDKGGMRAVASGSFDAYIDRWAAAAKKAGQPLLVRLGHEMNDPYRYPWGPQNNDPQDFIAAWQHVVSRFRLAGATNVAWVWSPHPAYTFAAYYPGDAFVDWVGVGTLNYGTVAAWSQWWSFADIFGKYYPQLATYKKPIMITEFGSLKVGGRRSQWFGDALNELPTKYPLVKSIVFYHNSDDNTTTMKVLDWTFKDDSAATHSIVRAVKAWGGK